MVAFHPIADTLAAALRTLVLLGVGSAIASLPAAAIVWRRRAGARRWLSGLAGPAITVHALNLGFFAVLSVWTAVDALAGAGWPGTVQLALFAASFLVPNVSGLALWSYVARRRLPEVSPHVVPRPPEL